MPNIQQVREAHQRNLSTVESPPNSNNVRYNTWYYGHPVSGQYPWCAVYQSYIWIVECGGNTGLGPKGSASCSVWVAAHQRNGTWGTTPREGAFVFYGPGGGSHIEWVDVVTSSGIWTYGGNTGGSNPYAGGGVWRQFRPYNGSERIYGYGYPTYDATPTTEEDEDMLLILGADGVGALYFSVDMRTKAGIPSQAALAEATKDVKHAYLKISKDALAAIPNTNGQPGL